MSQETKVLNSTEDLCACAQLELDIFYCVYKYKFSLYVKIQNIKTLKRFKITQTFATKPCKSAKNKSVNSKQTRHNQA